MITGQPEDQSFPRWMVIGHSKCNPRVISVPGHNSLPSVARPAPLRGQLEQLTASPCLLCPHTARRTWWAEPCCCRGLGPLPCPFSGPHQSPELSQHLSSQREFWQHQDDSMALRPRLINHYFIPAISSAAIGIFISNQLLKMASFKGA